MPTYGRTQPQYRDENRLREKKKHYLFTYITSKLRSFDCAALDKTAQFRHRRVLRSLLTAVKNSKQWVNITEICSEIS